MPVGTPSGRRLPPRLIAAAAFVAAAAVGSSAAAQSMDGNYWLEGAAYWPSIDTHVSVSTKPGNAGTDIDLESDLKMDDHQVLPAFFAGARLGHRIWIGGEYYALNRSGSVSASRDIVFDNVTFPAGVKIDSAFSSDIYRMSLGYSFIRNDQAELGAALGLQVTQFDVALSGEGRIGNNIVVQNAARRREVTAPVPTIGVYGAYRPMPRLTLSGRIDYVSATIDKFSGHLLNTQAKVSYRIINHVAVGAMYRYVDYKLGVDNDDWTADVAYKFSGPAIFLEVSL